MASPAARSAAPPRVYIGQPLGFYLVEEAGTGRLYQVPDRYRGWSRRQEYTGSLDGLRVVRERPAAAIAARLGAVATVRAAPGRRSSMALLRLLPAIGAGPGAGQVGDVVAADGELGIARHVAGAYVVDLAAGERLREALRALAEAEAGVDRARAELRAAEERVAAAVRSPGAAPEDAGR